MLIAFHQLPLAAMFLVVWSISTAICWLLIGLVRFAVPRMGYRLSEPLPIRDSLINACGALFALIVAFSAAGIWNDAVSARTAVQREAEILGQAQLLRACPAQDQVLPAARGQTVVVGPGDGPMGASLHAVSAEQAAAEVKACPTVRGHGDGFHRAGVGALRAAFWAEGGVQAQGSAVAVGQGRGRTLGVGKGLAAAPHPVHDGVEDIHGAPLRDRSRSRTG